MSSISELKTHFLKAGKIEWIGLRNKNNKNVLQVETAELLLDHGLAGDKSAQKPGSKRQVTLIQAEYFAVMESLLQKNKILPEALRRNIVVSGINLSILLRHNLKINDAELEITGNCAPCKKMEEKLGYGGFNAMRNHGGVNAIVRKGGVINVGDVVEVCLNVSNNDSPQKSLL
ncbi:MAG: MOSC domain-containing protein [Gammaproteobacteria bacterium]